MEGWKAYITKSVVSGAWLATFALLNNVLCGMQGFGKCTLLNVLCGDAVIRKLTLLSMQWRDEG